MSLNRNDITAAKISTAANVGIGTRPTTPENATRMISIQTPAKIDAQRLRAPAATFSDVLLTEPPTGVPWKKPDARLATPCPMKSRLVSDGRPLFGADSATPAPCTRAMAAMANAPLITPAVRSLRCGSTNGGSPLGIAPTSATVSMSFNLTNATTIVGMTTATRDANSAMRVRFSKNMAANAATPTIVEARLIPLGWVTT